MTLSKEDKQLITIVLVLASPLPIIIIASNFSTIMGLLFAVGALLVPALYYIMIFLAVLAGVWIAVRVVRHAWRS